MDIRAIIKQGKRIPKKTFSELRYTHNTSPNALKQILKEGKFQYYNLPLGINFRYGLDAAFGPLKIIMKKDFDVVMLRKKIRYAPANIPYVWMENGKIIVKDKTSKLSNEKGILKTTQQIAENIDFRKNLPDVKITMSELVRGVRKNKFVMLTAKEVFGKEFVEQGDESTFLRSYFFPQLNIYKDVSIDHIDKIIIPAYLYKYVKRFCPDALIMKVGAGKTRQPYGGTRLKWSRKLGQFIWRSEKDRRWLVQKGHMRPETSVIDKRRGINIWGSHPSRCPQCGPKAFFKEEQAYYLHILDLEP